MPITLTQIRQVHPPLCLRGIVDQTVKSIGRTYDTLGRTTHVTSYSTNNGSGTPLNQLGYTYDSTYGTLEETDQEHDGAVDGSTLSVRYGYDETADGSNRLTNGLRQSSLRTPWHQANSKYLWLYYGASGSATETRFDRLHQISGQFEQNGSYPIADDYRYAGVNRLWTARTRWANGGANQLYLHYDGAALGDTTRGYDRFGQVIGHSTSGSAGASSFAYTYDYAGNRLTRDAITSTNNVWDQKYAYDDLLRLATSDEGTLSSGNISSPTFEEDYALDQLGNWQTLVKKTGGSTTLDQSRAHNEANETGTIGATTGTNWADPVHDDAGNMTTIPQPKAPASGYTAIYDAWNRMVEVKDGGTTVQANEYDGLHRRIVRDETGGSGAVRHFYYNERWQCVEERDGSLAFVKRHFWHPYYIDALAASIDSTGERVSFVHDANFNVTMAVNDTYNAATVIERYHYSPYGEVTYLNPDFSVKGTQMSAVGNEYLYTGRRLDPETGIYHYRYRYYHAQLGRFVTRDPIGYLDGMNLYQYVNSSPLLLLDPSGMGSSTGPCTVNIFIGHASLGGAHPEGDEWFDSIYNTDEGSGVVSPKPRPGEFDGPDACDVYSGALTCFNDGGAFSDDREIPEHGRIPGFPSFSGVITADEIAKLAAVAERKARELGNKLCRNRKELPEEYGSKWYDCGDRNKTCDSVTITITCDPDAERLFKAGIGPRPGNQPGVLGPQQLRNTKSICGKSITKNCLAEGKESHWEPSTAKK